MLGKVYHNIEYWLDKKFISPSTFCFRISKILSYLPILWNDHDWSEQSVFVLLQHKIKRQKVGLLGDACHQSPTMYRKMDICINLLDRLIKDDYYENVFKEHEDRWGALDIIFENRNPLKMTAGFDIYRPNARTIEEKRRELAESHVLYKREKDLREQDLQMFAKLFAKQVIHWSC